MRQNVLLLQGPIGPFFRHFARDLEHRGFKVHKINFNGGDRFFYNTWQADDFRGELSDWESYLETYLRQHAIGRIYLFGDCRFYHRVAKNLAEKHNIRVFVFEEGYLRPNFITLEEHGVNGNSSILKKNLDLQNYGSHNEDQHLYANRVFRNMVIYASLYYVASALLYFRFPGYVHHRPLNFASEGSKWLLSLWRKVKYKIRQKNLRLLFASDEMNDKYFLCPLQVHCDMQIGAHSGYISVEHFISDIVQSFAKDAPKDRYLVFKHHPMDRGYTDYTVFIEKLVGEFGLAGRVFYVHDLDLPMLLKGACGTVLINSTVGMSSLLHGTPVKVMGKAIYDRPGLTHQSSLEGFWSNPGTVNKGLYRRFRDYLITKNQINGNFYKKLKNLKSQAGILWSEEMSSEHVFDAARVDTAKPPQLQVVAGRDYIRYVGPGDINDQGKLAS